MSLRDADIKSTYFLNETSPYFFYNELYLHATEITIALGYFTKTAFCIGTEALLYFIKNSKGHIHIICNEKILLEDATAISQGYDLREKGSVSIQDFEDLIKAKDLNDFQIFSYKCLSYLIALGRLDIRIAKSNRLVHFKVGYARDDEGNVVAFSGSVNYTLSALLYNWEQLTTYSSWVNPEAFAPRIKEIVEPIDVLFKGNIEGLPLIGGHDIESYIREIYPTQDYSELEQDAKLAKRKIKIKLGPKKIKLLENDDNPAIFSVPPTLSPRPHQIEALKNYEENDYKSLFAMATGTGKTLTSLFAVNDLSFSVDVQSVLILVPLQDLVKQWLKDINKVYSGNVILVGSDFSNWKEKVLYHGIQIRELKKNRNVVIISTYDSYQRNSDLILKSIDLNKTVLIADEVHTFGAENKKNRMPPDIPYRIGLSATPKRAYDDSGTKAIFDFFCPSENPYVFGLDKAIDAGFLCKYNYYPVIVPLTFDEYDHYQELTEKIKKMSAHSSDDDDRELLTKKLKERHRIIENASNKRDAVKDYFEQHIDEDLSKTIVFCPEGKNDDEDFSNLSLIQQDIWSVFKSARKQIRLAKYIQGTESSVLQDFTDGKIDIILSKKRLNEGIDIPSTRRALFVSSSTSEREFIQRRGRVLRTALGKEIAEIVDFIVVPPERGAVFQNELERFVDFARTAENTSEALQVINEHIGDSL